MLFIRLIMYCNTTSLSATVDKLSIHPYLILYVFQGFLKYIFWGGIEEKRQQYASLTHSFMNFNQLGGVSSGFNNSLLLPVRRFQYLNVVSIYFQVIECVDKFCVWYPFKSLQSKYRDFFAGRYNVLPVLVYGTHTISKAKLFFRDLLFTVIFWPIIWYYSYVKLNETVVGTNNKVLNSDLPATLYFTAE